MTEEPQWIDDGPVLRPYALTRGRTPPPASSFDLLALIVSTTTDEPPAGTDLGPEHLRLLHLVRRARRVADLASDLNLPLAVTRLLLSDLQSRNLITVRPPAMDKIPDAALLHEVLKGLQAL
ncbi:DUF742 domain-containing protein [Sphaerisporangium sp. NPDC051011]|uniref:DUF742 domain-containing protein n=1 Tax=Sphaerisporangium sp. NPDC051011 TaxID=3155792 RepID=UPI0033C88E5C